MNLRGAINNTIINLEFELENAEEKISELNENTNDYYYEKGRIDAIRHYLKCLRIDIKLARD